MPPGGNILADNFHAGFVNAHTHSHCIPWKGTIGSMPLENFGSKKIKRMKAGYISKPGDNKTFMNNCAKLINSKKLRKIFFKNSKNYLKTRQASIDRMITNIEQLKKK